MKKTKKSSKRDAAQLAEIEARIAKHTKENAQLRDDNRKLRAQNIAERRMREAKRMLAEAEVPSGILSASDLVQFEPHQWAAMIKQARRHVRVQETEKAKDAPPRLRDLTIGVRATKAQLTAVLATLAPDKVASFLAGESSEVPVMLARDGEISNEQLAALCTAFAPDRARSIVEAFRINSAGGAIFVKLEKKSA